MSITNNDWTPQELSSGEAITRWLYSDAVATYFPGERRPQPDNVDYRFGLIGAKPGISPAREALDARPAPDDIGPPMGPFDKLYIGSHSPNVDFSCFAFVPTLIRRTFRCRLHSAKAGQAQFRISTCGAIRIWVGDRLAIRYAPFSGLQESDKLVTLELPGGPVDVTVELEQLHERNTANFFSLTYISGVPIAASVDAPEAGRLQAAADALDGLEADRVFFTGGPLKLRTLKAVPEDLPLEITHIQQISRADAWECLDLPTVPAQLKAGDTTVTLPDLPVLPTGCTEIHVCADIAGTRIRKSIGTTILTRGVKLQGTTVAARKAEVLELAASDTGCEATVALALLAGGHASPKIIRILDEALSGIEERRDCSDFTMQPVLRIWRDYREALPDAVRTRMRDAILGWRYWLSEPGHDAMWFWSENHVLCFHSAQLIAGSLFPDEVFSNSGRTGAEHRAEALSRLHRWFDSIERDGLCEWNSAAYYPIDMFALLTLHDMTPEPALRDRAAALLDRIFVMTGLHMTGGTPAGAQGRGYEKELLSGPANELGAIGAVAFGGTWYPAYGRAALNFCLSSYEPPEIAAQLGNPKPGQVIEAQYTQGLDQLGKLKLWKTAAAQLSTVSDHMTGTLGVQQHVLDAQFSAHPLARLWINHPGDRKPWSERRPSKLAGNHWLPRVAQDGPRAFAIYDLPDDPRFVPFVQLFSIADAFDRIETAGEHLLFASGGATAVIWCSVPLEPETSGPYAGSVRRANALRSAWTLRLEATPDAADFDKLAASVSREAPRFDQAALRLTVGSHVLDYSTGLTRDGVPVGHARLDPTPCFGIDGSAIRPWSKT